MLQLIEWLITVGIVLCMVYIGAPQLAWIPIVAVWLVIVSIWGTIPWEFVAVFWILFLGVAGVFGLPAIRMSILTTPVMKFLRKAMPPMSDTEREAIEAGGVWWDAQIFTGKPKWKRLLKTPKPALTDEEQAFLDGPTNNLCTMLNDWQIYQDKDLPQEVWDYLKKEKFFGIVIKKEYGGLEFSAQAHSAIVTRIATCSLSAAVTTMVPNSLGPGELIENYGTDEQKQQHLPRLASGEDIPCFGLTENNAGSDATGMEAKGVVCKGTFEGKEIVGIKLNGHKRYITLAPVATLIGLAFKLYDPEHLMGEKDEYGITVALVPSTVEGVENGRRHMPMGLAFMNGTIDINDAFIPLDYIIGGPVMAGHGWRMLVECLSVGRAISLPSLSNAAAMTCYRTIGAYAQLREQFHTSILNFEGIQEKLASIAGEAYMLNATRVLTQRVIDLGRVPSVLTTICKYQLTESMRRIVNDAMDVASGSGIQLGPNNNLGLAYAGIPIAITVEGANILTRSLMIFGQGAIRCHPYAYKEMQAVANPDKHAGTKELDKLLCKHVGYMAQNVVRSALLGLTGGLLSKAPTDDKRVATYYRSLSRFSSVLALYTDAAMMILGGKLKFKESLSARLGDVLSNIYMASAVLKYFEDHGRNDDDVLAMRWSLDTCLYNIQRGLLDFANNFPNKFVGWTLKSLAFPLGAQFLPPADDVVHKLAKHMGTPGEYRDRVTEYIAKVDSPDNHINVLDEALALKFKVQESRDKIRQAVKSEVIDHKISMLDKIDCALSEKLISEQEADDLRKFEDLLVKVVGVADFDKDYFKSK